MKRHSYRWEQYVHSTMSIDRETFENTSEEELTDLQDVEARFNDDTPYAPRPSCRWAIRGF
ncbi:hypothetical protein C9J85_19585 [Haloferax sp. wsp5]|nr:hypothetical protein C9J85_19585 [Haloferax sp. wsp5]